MVKRLDIQGLRAVAVLAVLAFHAGLPLSGGFVGVDVFFVVSGFLVIGMLAREYHVNSALNLPLFFRRRFWRLAPVFLVVVSISLVVVLPLVSPFGPQENGAVTALASIFGVGNVAVVLTSGGYFDASAKTNPFLHTWSLSVEEQFYLIIPIALLVALWIQSKVSKRSPQNAPSLGVFRFVLWSVAVISVCFVVAAEAGNLPAIGKSAFGYLSPMPRIWEFTAGGLLALNLAEKSYSMSRLQRKFFMGMGVLGLVTSFLIFDENHHPYPGFITLVPVVATLSIILSGSAEKSSPHKTPNQRYGFLSSKPMVLIGDWSYSLYLWHWPLAVAAMYLYPDNSIALVVMVLMAFPFSYLSFTYVEQRYRHAYLGSSLKFQARKASYFVATASVTAMAVLYLSSVGFGDNKLLDFKQTLSASSFSDREGCSSRLSPSEVPVSCKIEYSNSRVEGHVYLVGDSNAGHFSDAFVAAARETGVTLTVATTSACPFIALNVIDLSPVADNASCLHYNLATLSSLDGALPGTVVISNSEKYISSSQYILEPYTSYPVTQSTKLPGTIPANSREGVWFDAMSETVKRIRGFGHKVVVAQSIPKWTKESGGSGPSWDPSLCSTITALRAACFERQFLFEHLERTRLSRELNEAVARTFSQENVSLWDPAFALCPSGLCSTQFATGSSPRLDGLPKYRDSGHLSVLQSIELAPEILWIFGREELAG